MKIRAVLATAGIALVATASASFAQATQDVSYEVQAINELSFSGAPSLVINSATAGSAPTSATASASYAITTNETNRKITASIGSAMPNGVTLTVALDAPGVGTSAGAVTLSTTAADVVTGISTAEASNVAVSYGLSATTAAGVIPAGTATVTYTILAGA
jgi:hypothetical protein